jgi:hypothetical protein
MGLRPANRRESPTPVIPSATRNLFLLFFTTKADSSPALQGSDDILAAFFVILLQRARRRRAVTYPQGQKQASGRDSGTKLPHAISSRL